MTARRTCALVLVFLLANSGGSAADAPSSKVRVAYPPIIASLPYYVIKEGKVQTGTLRWEETGITSSNDMLNALVADRVDLLPAVSLIPVIHLEIASPGRVRLFSHSRMTADRAFDSIIVPAKSKIKRLTDLRGKRIGVFPGTSARRLLATFLSRQRVRESRITFIPLEPQAQMAALQSGSIDALYAYEPTTTIATRSGYRKLFGSVYAALLDKNPVGCSVISRTFERRDPAGARAAVAALDAGVTFMRNRQADARQMLPKYTKIQPDIAAAANVVDVTLHNEVDPKKLQAFIDLLYQIGEIPERIDARRLL